MICVECIFDWELIFLPVYSLPIRGACRDAINRVSTINHVSMYNRVSLKNQTLKGLKVSHNL